MYKNLSGDGLGVSCRQNELVELALTYGFRGIEVDIAEMQSRAERFSPEFARRFVDSAKNGWNLQVGTFKLPFRLDASPEDYTKAMTQFEACAELAAAIEAQRCYVDLTPGSDDQAYHDNFELHRTRVAEVADLLAKHNIRLGLGIQAAPAARQGLAYQFIYQAEPLLTLIKTIGHPAVGLALDSWNWAVGDGALDQIEELGANDVVCVRLADIPEDADPEKIEDSQRLLPGRSAASRAPAIVKHLDSLGYDGPVAVNPHSSQFSGVTRDNIVQQASQALDNVFTAAGIHAPVGVAAEENGEATAAASENNSK